MAKRMFDILLSLFGLILFSPVLAVIALQVKGEDGGLVLYRGVRVGRYGSPFKIFKFRTMVVGAERIGGASTADDGPRVTRVGRLLRTYELNELLRRMNVFIVIKEGIEELHFGNFLRKFDNAELL